MTEAWTCLDEAALFLAAQHGAVERLRCAHRPRPDGSCRSCGVATPWPCVQIAIADRADRLSSSG